MKKIILLLLATLATNFAHSQVLKKDVLRIEFEHNQTIETIDLNREYSEEDGKLKIQIKPERVSDYRLNDKKPSVVWKIDVQGGTVSVLSNFSQIPGDTGTEFSIDGQTIANYRLYLSTLIKEKHEIRLLYAPLEYNTMLTPQTDIFFKDSLFLEGLDTDAFYKFNSYRLSYIYHFNQTGDVQLRVGFTAKIRDAETSLSQSQVSEAFINVGFVPLIHLGAKIQLAQRLLLDAEAEGSWAPQGYAVDSRLSLNYNFSRNLSVGAGAGYLDGGANVESVNTFARLFYGYGKVTITFGGKKKKDKKFR